MNVSPTRHASSHHHTALYLTPHEAQQFERYLRPRIETGQGTKRVAQVYLWATKGVDAQVHVASPRDEGAEVYAL